LERAVAHLREWPLDLRRHSYTNSHRDDLYAPKGYRVCSGQSKPLSPRETEPNRWDGDFARTEFMAARSLPIPAAGRMRIGWAVTMA